MGHCHLSFEVLIRDEEGVATRGAAVARRVSLLASEGGNHMYDLFLRAERPSDPRDLLITYPSEPMTMWPISTRVNSPDNDDPSLLDRAEEPIEVWAPL